MAKNKITSEQYIGFRKKNSHKSKNKVNVGKIVNTRGLKGQLKVISSSSFDKENDIKLFCFKIVKIREKIKVDNNMKIKETECALKVDFMFLSS